MKKTHICLITIAALMIIGSVVLYCAIPKYVVYAVKGTKNGTIREEVCKSISQDKARSRHLYLNGHKEEGVRYVLVDEETGNSVIPF